MPITEKKKTKTTAMPITKKESEDTNNADNKEEYKMKTLYCL